MRQGDLKPVDYVSRVHDQRLACLLDTFDAVEVVGPMWCGKTWSSLAFGESVTRVGRESVRRAVEADPGIALLGRTPHVIDEWQDVAQIWDVVRDDVDGNSGRTGSYILTGSSTPAKTAVHHSGAGRIARMRITTMTLAEMGLSSGSVSLSGLFEGHFEPSSVQQHLAPLADVVCMGGWPALLHADASAAAEYVDAYLDSLFDVNIPKRGLNGDDSRQVATSLARNMGNAVTLATVAADAFPDESRASAEKKCREHIAALEALYIVESVHGWDAPIRSKSRLRTKPKRYFADPSLAAALLGVQPSRLLEDGQLFGVLFEALCLHDLAAYAAVLPRAPKAPLHYYRDSDGLEVDAIIELRDGRWAAFEVKLGEAKVDDAVRSLHRLKEKIALNPAARNPEPEFMAVIVGAGEFARYDPQHDIYVIPITALGQ